jgi:chromosome partitioning protein
MTKTTRTEPTATDGGTETTRISVVNQKGGIGKTTTCIHLAGALAARKHNVLVVDLDPNGSLTRNLGYGDDFNRQDELSLYEILLNKDDRDAIHDIILHHDEFDILPSNDRMQLADGDLMGEPGAEQRLDRALDLLNGTYDYILVDCPPSLSKLTDNALIAAPNLILPLYAEPMSTTAVPQLVEQIDALEEYFPVQIQIRAIVANRIEVNNVADDVLDSIETSFEKTPKFKIRKRVALQRAINNQHSIFASTEECDMAAVYEDLADTLDEQFNKTTSVEVNQ